MRFYVRAVARKNDKFILNPLRKSNNRRRNNTKNFCVNAYFVATAARARNKPMNDHTPPYTPTNVFRISQFVYYTIAVVFVRIGSVRLLCRNKTQRQRSKMCKQTLKCGNVHQSTIFIFIRNEKKTATITAQTTGIN